MEYLELLEDGKFQAIKLSNTSCSDALGKGKKPYFPIGTVIFFQKAGYFLEREKIFSIEEILLVHKYKKSILWE